MNILKHRPLLRYTLLFLLAFALLYGIAEGVKLIFIILTASTALLLLLLGRCRRGLWRTLLPFSLVLLILASSALPSLIYAVSDDKTEKYVDQEAFASVVIHEISYDKYGFRIASGYLISIMGEKQNVGVTISYTARAGVGDVLCGKALIEKMNPEDPEDSYSLSLGYRYRLTFDSAFRASTKNTLPVISAKMQTSLCNLINKYTQGEGAPLLSTILLGEKKGLSDVVERDMRRLGLSHMLALSGMHFSLILLGLESILSKFSVDKRIRYTLLAIITILYLVAIGGTLSALRAGIMLLGSLLFFALGSEYDALTMLGLSVAGIVTVLPYAITNLSLLLSAFASLGILLSIQSDYGDRDTEEPAVSLPGRLWRWLLTSAKITLAASFATLPLMVFYFGNLSLLLVPANLLFAPLIQLLLYASIAVLFLGFLPPVAAFGSFIARITTSLAAWMSGIPHTQISIRHPSLLIPLLIATCLFLLLYLFPPPRKTRQRLARILLCTVLLISISAVGIRRLVASDSLSVYYAATDTGRGDLLVLSENSHTAVIDITNGVKEELLDGADLMQTQYLTEIDSYVVTAYHTALRTSLSYLLSNQTIHHLYLPSPSSEEEEGILSSLLKAASNAGCTASLYEAGESLSLGESHLTLHPALLGQTKGSLSFSLHYGEKHLLYLSAEAVSIPSWYSHSERAANADIVLFGSYGADKEDAFRTEAKQFSEAPIYAPSERAVPFMDKTGILIAPRHTFRFHQ